MNDMPAFARVRVEWVNGRQVIYLPKGFTIATTEVRVTAEGGRVILEEPEDGIEAETGLPMAEFRALIAEGDAGPDEAWDIDEIKSEVRAALAAERGGR